METLKRITSLELHLRMNLSAARGNFFLTYIYANELDKRGDL